MTIDKEYISTKFSIRWLLLVASLLHETACRPQTTGRSIQWFPDSDDFSITPFEISLNQGDIVEFVCKSEYPMSFYRVEKEDYNSCRKTIHSTNLGSCDNGSLKVHRTLRGEPSPNDIVWKSGTYYIIAVDTVNKLPYCREHGLRMMLNVLGTEQPKIRTTTEIIPTTTSYSRIQNIYRDYKIRNKKTTDRNPALPAFAERINSGKPLSPQEILNGQLTLVTCITTPIKNGSENEKESTPKKGAACIMLNPYYSSARSIDLVGTAYLPLFENSAASLVVFPILVAFFNL